MASNMKKKTEKIAATKDKRPYATAKYIRISPYKVRTVLALMNMVVALDQVLTTFFSPAAFIASILAISLSSNLGKAGKTRHLGTRPTVRGSVMNPNDHPHGVNDFLFARSVHCFYSCHKSFFDVRSFLNAS